MGFKESTSNELFRKIFDLTDKCNFDEAKKIVLACVPKDKHPFLKEFEMFPKKVLPLSTAQKWLIENISYGSEEIPSFFAQVNFNISISDDHVFYIDVACLDAVGSRIKNMLNESMLVLETNASDDYGFELLSSDCDRWCELDNDKIDGLKFNGKDIGSRVVYDCFATIVLMEYVIDLETLLRKCDFFKKINFIHQLSILNDEGNRIKIS